MQKFIISTIVFIAAFCATVTAQQKYIAEAVLQPGGHQVLKLTDSNGKATTITGSTNEEIQSKYASLVAAQSVGLPTSSKPKEASLFVPHSATMLLNGSQEIRWTDAAGKERVVTAGKGESIQEKYLAYLQKEGVPCGCSPAVKSVPANENSAKIAVKP